MRILLTSIVFILAMSWCCSEADGGSYIYKWRDDSGKLHFTDSPETVPEHHRSQLSLRPWRSSPDSRSAIELTRVPLSRERGALIVPIWVNMGHKLLFFLDTGSTYSQITPQDAVALGVDVDRLPPVNVQTADGRSLQSKMVLLDSVRIGSYEVHNLEALVGNVRLLGLNALERFKVTLDLRRGEMLLEPFQP